MRDPLLNIAVSAARLAGDIITRAYDRLDTISIKEKTASDLVTNVDLQAEQAIIDEIHKAYPDHAILAEESGSQGMQDGIVWVIDPLDGTNNFAHGFPHFAISIAIQQAGKTTHGIIYDPLRDELFTALRGSGSMLNNQRIRVTDHTHLKHALLGTGFPFRHKELISDYLKTFEPLAHSTTGIRRAGSAALDLAYVAAGRLDGFWEFNLQKWDIAAGALLVQEAGGRVSDFQGGETYLKSGNIIASNRKVFKELLQTINTGLRSE